MNRLQKMAVFNLFFLGFILLVCAAILYAVRCRDGAADLWKQLGAICGLGCVMLLLLLCVQSWPNSKKAKPTEFDERDQKIQIKALLTALWGFFGTFLWMMWLVIPRNLTMEIGLWILLFCATIIGFIVYSASIFIFNRKG